MVGERERQGFGMGNHPLSIYIPVEAKALMAESELMVLVMENHL